MIAFGIDPDTIQNKATAWPLRTAAHFRALPCIANFCGILFLGLAVFLTFTFRED